MQRLRRIFSDLVTHVRASWRVPGELIQQLQPASCSVQKRRCDSPRCSPTAKRRVLRHTLSCYNFGMVAATDMDSRAPTTNGTAVRAYGDRGYTMEEAALVDKGKRTHKETTASAARAAKVSYSFRFTTFTCQPGS